MTILRIAKANFIKKKSVFLTITVFIILASMMLNMGVGQLLNLDDFYETKEELLQSPHIVNLTQNNIYKNQYGDFIFQDSRIEHAEKENVAYMPTSKNNRNSLEFAATFFNKDAKRKIAPFRLVKEDKSVPADKAIYMPLIMEQYNTKLGDNIEFSYKGNIYSFQVAGFFETTYMGVVSNGNLKYYVSDKLYQKLYESIGGATIIEARMKVPDNIDNPGKYVEMKSQQLIDDFLDKTDYLSNINGIFAISNCLDKTDMKNNVLSNLEIPSVVFIMLAIVVSIIILIIIFCKVIEMIDENMQNYGILQALGYTTNQIIGSILIEFIFVSLCGTILGVIASYIFPYFMSDTFSASSGLVWKQSLNIGVNLVSICIITFLILLISLLAGIKIKKLPPVVALRNGKQTHEFKKNLVPIYKGFGGLYFKLALKNVVMFIKQNIILLIIVTSSTFIVGMSFVMYINFGVNDSALRKMTGIEISDLQVIVTKGTDNHSFAKELEKTDGIRKTLLTDVTFVKVEKNTIQCIVSDAYDEMELLETVEGDFPRYDNEIVLTIPLAKKINKKIGDSVMVTIEGKSKDYTIVGLSQSSNGNGLMAMMQDSGIKRLRPNYQMPQIEIYLDQSTSAKDMTHYLEETYKIADSNLPFESNSISHETKDNEKFSAAKKKAEEKIAKLLADYGVRSASYAVMLDGNIILSGNSNSYKIKDITDLNGYLEGQLEVYSSLIGMVVIITLIVILLIIAGILSISIGTMLRQKKEEHAIYKALGYTTKELMIQMSLSLVIVSLIGAALGGILTFCLSNIVLRSFFSYFGMSKINLVNSPFVLIIMGIFIVAFVFLMAMRKTYSIRKVTPYELMTE